jgi:hypothetical protein
VNIASTCGLTALPLAVGFWQSNRKSKALRDMERERFASVVRLAWAALKIQTQFRKRKWRESWASGGIHVRGIGVHNWDGTLDGTGTYEDKDQLKALFKKFGEVLAVVVRT